MLNRKVKKLIRDPKLFFSDMVNKQKKKINIIQPKEYNGNYQYTVVSAVYNVGRYLDEYFNSIIKQRLDFKKHIHLILVDDGSTDNSAEIIKRWLKKFPKNITYIYKENGGQASARNLGIQFVKTDWVTYLDPDDFIDPHYFISIDNFLKLNNKKPIDLISCNLISYFDDLKIYKDVHPLKYRYLNGDTISPVNSLGKQLQLSAATAFFKTSIITKNKINFDPRLKPSFEDAHFVSNYFIYIQDSNAAFLKSAKYFYRKRSDGSSTLDNAWKHPGLYDAVLEYGCLDILKKYHSQNVEIPKFIKFTILYHLIWFIKAIVNNPQKIYFLNEDQKSTFTKLIKEIFEYIDNKTILEFGLAGCWFYHKVGMLACFKQTDPDFQIVYIESYDPIKKLIELKYFSRKDELENITENGQEIYPYYIKSVKHEFISEEFVKEKRIWIPIQTAANFNIKIGNSTTLITLSGQQYKAGIKTDKIIEIFKNHAPKYESSAEYANSWLFMDRDVQADDNAEHLYEYVQKNHPENEIFFALTRNSHDWNRLKLKGFNLVEYGSDKHELILKSCSKLISSHADKYVTNYLGARMLSGRHFVFLQHGVIHNDLSDWLNQKENIDLFVTSSPAEYNAISGDNTHYKFTKKNVKLTGLPRFDKFHNAPSSSEKTLLIMPTWRANAVGKASGNGYLRDYLDDFMETKYAQHWYSFLHSDTLKEFSKKYKFKIIFFPHVNIAPYLKLFAVPEYIDVYRHTDMTIQELFIKSTMMVTDYSSVAFDMAALGKQTLYYQFDREEFFSGGHTLKKGYFDHYKHGFGPVVEDEQSLFVNLEKLLINNGLPDSLIQRRIDETFPVKDGRNCERVYQAICELDVSIPEKYYDLDILKKYALQASLNKNWNLASLRWKLFIELSDNITDGREKLYLSKAYRKSGKINHAIETIESINCDVLTGSNEYKVEYAYLLMCCNKWQDAFNVWEGIDALNKHHELSYFICLCESGDSRHIKLIDELTFTTSDNAYYIIARTYALISLKKWQEAIEYIIDRIDIFSEEELECLKPELIISRCYREFGCIEESSFYLEKYEKHSKNDISIKYELMRTAYKTEQWTTVITLFNNLDIGLDNFEPGLSLFYLKSLRNTGKYSLALEEFEKIPASRRNTLEYKVEIGEIYLSAKKWNSAAQTWLDLLNTCDFACYKLAVAYRMLGLIEEALEVITTSQVRMPVNMNEWLLRAELAYIAADWEEASNSWSSILRFYPENAPKECWERLSNARLMMAFSKLETASDTHY